MLLELEMKEKIIDCFMKYAAVFPIELDTFQQFLTNTSEVRLVSHTEEEVIAELYSMYDIVIFLNNFQKSYCTCRDSEPCVHFGIVLLHLFDGLDNPYTLLARTVSTINDMPLHIEAWYGYFEIAWERFNDANVSFWQQHNFLHDYMFVEQIYQLFYMEFLDNINTENKGIYYLYQLHGAFYTYYRMLEKISQSQLREMSMFELERLIEPMFEQMLELLDVATNDIWDNDSLCFLENSMHYFDTLLIDEFSLFEQRIYLYRLLWLELPVTKEVAKKHGQKLESYPKTEGIAIASCHLAFIIDDDERALQKLAEMDENSAIYAMMWVAIMLETEQWARLKRWLPVIIEKVSQLLKTSHNNVFLEEVVIFYLNHFEEYAKENDDMDLYETLLKKWLPYSYPYYDYFLIREKQFMTWTELQLLVNAPIQSLDKNILQVVEKEAPDCLLPLYHRQVIELIAEKNRRSYKEAVKLLRKLRTYYRKLKRMTEWEKYIKQLASTYSRLRALQEELRKGRGKLIDD